MVYTVTLNPALDRTLCVDKLVANEANRITKETRYAGGKGIDVSRVLLELGIESIVLGFVGGYTGRELEGRLFNKGLTPDFIHITGETRTNVIIRTKSNQDYILNVPGPEIHAEELSRLYNKIKSVKRRPTIVVISGSIPRGISPRIYAQLTLVFESLGAKVIVDSSGKALKESIKATPFLIKPNLKEFCQLIGKEIKEKKALIQEAKKIVKKGVEYVVISLREKGALVVSAEKIYEITPPLVEVRNSIGAGDSLVAGIVAGMKQGKKMEEALKLGVAAGTATVTLEGTALATKEKIKQIISGVKLTEL